ncbi:MAG: GH3 auxin-responsive promoter family protein [Flavobacteriaceae bacterium]|tara:strand:+ start:829 stop:2331 length:1503 start_codon:yes stop_codon:yes gene_type:complete
MASIKAYLSKLFAAHIARKIKGWSDHPIDTQNRVFKDLIKSAINTQFGKDHNFSLIKDYKAFVQNVPVRDYEALKPYVEKAVRGESDVLWEGKPRYFAKTSGTTSGAKHIPITAASIKAQVEASRNAMLMYIHETGKAGFLDGKWIFLQGSPNLNEKNGIKTGRLSGISAHYVPSYLLKNRMPSWDVNCIDDWETKIDAIVDETLKEDMTAIAGIPSWVQMYFEKLIERKQKKVGEMFKNFNLFIFGGVNYEPYRKKFENMIGRKVDSIELYPASEGFFAFQDRQNKTGMLLQLDSGIFYEFIEVKSFYNENPTRLTLKDVELGVNYVIIISTNAGLWAYNIGDTVQFTSIAPFRIIVSGRIKHFISAFGEHVIANEVEQAIIQAVKGTKIRVTEFTVAPEINPKEGLPYHEWLIEFEAPPKDLEVFEKAIDLEMQKQNSYYLDLIKGKVLQTLKISLVKAGGFKQYMKSIGKLGGQNKTPRLSNDRKMASYIHNNNLLK